VITYFLFGFACALIGSLPLFFCEKIGAGIAAFIVEGFVVWAIAYGSAMGFVGPLGGGLAIVMVVSLLSVNGLIAMLSADYEPMLFRSFGLPALALCAVALLSLGQAGCFRAGDYARMIGPVETKAWTEDVQPKDPRHMRMATIENAMFLATKVIGNAGAIGSQFQLDKASMTLQRVHGELWYIAPLDFAGFGAWSNSDGVPAYIMVSGEDPHRDALLVKLPEGQRLRYTPGAWFDNQLERHLRAHGYLNQGLTDFNFELDENLKPWWVVTVYQPEVVWSAPKVTGVVIVDPVTGEDKFYPMGQIPEWVDRAMPGWLIKDYLAWQGGYVHGWANQFWFWEPHKDLTEPEDPNLIYGSNDQPEWVTAITSANAKDQSIIALVYTNSRTGKSVRYEMKGGSVDSAVVDAVNKNQQVQFRHLHGSDPQLYNVYGVPTAVVPLLADNHAFQGVAMADIRNIQTIAVGENQYGALRDYERQLSQTVSRVGLDKERIIQTFEGLVDRVGMEVSLNGTLFYIHIAGVPHLFNAGSAQFHALPVTQIGDKVRIGCYNASRDVAPMDAFDNLSLRLDSSLIQQEVMGDAVQKKEAEHARQDSETIKERLMNLSPEELQKLKSQLSPTKQ
jgi:hypothetical protein